MVLDAAVGIPKAEPIGSSNPRAVQEGIRRRLLDSWPFG
jgi:hypothetical protein